MSPPAASLATHPVPASCDLSSAASILLSMSNDELPAQDIETSEEQHNSSDGANASRKGQPWTEEEHLAFLQGLRKLGKGNWRQISKSFVPSRTPTQVASHAQKHFMRIAGATKRKSRFTALEVEVLASSKSGRPSECVQGAQASQQCAEQQPAPALQPSTFPTAAFPAMPFPFMHPMMFGFPGPFFPPFMCAPPAFAAAALTALQKQGQIPVMMPPMFPMAAMAAMNPFFMAQQMAAAAQQAVAANAAGAVASGGGATVGTGTTATTDTATSGEAAVRPQSAPGSPTLCKPEPQHPRRQSPSGSPGEVAEAGAAASSPEGSTACANGGLPASSAGASADRRQPSPAPVPAPVPAAAQGLAKGEDAPSAFHTSAHSAFRPPQEIKTEG